MVIIWRQHASIRPSSQPASAPIGTVRLRMTLWNVAVLALILGVLGGVVRHKVRADRFATVGRSSLITDSVGPVDYLHAWDRAKMSDVSGHEGRLPGEGDAGDKEVGVADFFETPGTSQPVEDCGCRVVKHNSRDPGKKLLCSQQQFLGSEDFGGYRCLEEIIVPAAENLDLSYDSRAKIRVVDGL
jgi:hypothetical protein